MDLISWNGVGKRREFRGPIIKIDKSDQLSALFGKQAESTAQLAHAAKWPKKAKDKQNSDRQHQLIHSSKSMTKHGPIPVI